MDNGEGENSFLFSSLTKSQPVTTESKQTNVDIFVHKVKQSKGVLLFSKIFSPIASYLSGPVFGRSEINQKEKSKEIILKGKPKLPDLLMPADLSSLSAPVEESASRFRKQKASLIEIISKKMSLSILDQLNDYSDDISFIRPVYYNMVDGYRSYLFIEEYELVVLSVECKIPPLGNVCILVSFNFNFNFYCSIEGCRNVLL
jgi:hypothetical protein